MAATLLALAVFADEGGTAQTATLVTVFLAAISATASFGSTYLGYRTSRDKLQFDANFIKLQGDNERLKVESEECRRDREVLHKEQQRLQGDMARMQELIQTLSANFRVAVHDIKDTAHVAITKVQLAQAQQPQPGGGAGS